MALAHDPLWPRAGGWPAPTPVEGDGWMPRSSACRHGAPRSRRRVRTRRPAAVREALRALQPDAASDRRRSTSARCCGSSMRATSPSPTGRTGEDAVRARVRELAAPRGAGRSRSAATTPRPTPSRRAPAATGLITIDAHFDLRDGVSNGSPVRRLVEDGLDPRRIVQLGIADFANSVAYAQRAADWGITVVTLDDVRRRGADDVAAQALEIAGAGGGARSTSTSTSTSATAPSRPAARRRCRAGSPPWELRALVRALARDARLAQRRHRRGRRDGRCRRWAHGAARGAVRARTPRRKGVPHDPPRCSSVTRSPTGATRASTTTTVR